MLPKAILTGRWSRSRESSLFLVGAVCGGYFLVSILGLAGGPLAPAWPPPAATQRLRRRQRVNHENHPPRSHRHTRMTSQITPYGSTFSNPPAINMKENQIV
jgi:hypothetical protein